MSSSDHIVQQLDAYRHPRLLGQDSFGNIYLAEHVLLNRQVVIRVLLHASLTKENREIFWNEAISISHLHHPNIVQIYDWGMNDDMAYIVMDYAPRGSLRQRHPKGTQVPLPVIIGYVKQITMALQHAHHWHIIHRDVKPENMLLGSNDRILLSDFGIAVMAHTTSSQGGGEVAGTVTYMAPEQLEGKPSSASDQYALAVTVYEWLCGEPPFQGAPVEVAQRHLFSPPPLIRVKNPAIPRAIEAVVLRALAKNPTDRFQNVKDFAIALELAHTLMEENQSLLSENQRERLALSILAKPLLLPKAYYSFYNALGKALSTLGFNNKALMAYERAILLEAHHPQLYVRKGEALFNLKRYKEALTAFDEAIRLAPESSKAYQGRGKTFEQLAQQSYDELKQRAQQSYEKAKELGVE